MKKILSLLLVLSLLLLSLSGLSEAEADAPTPLPEVGGVIHGFELKETHDYPLINAVFYRFEHQRTGAEVFYCAADDLNRVFDLVFRTEAIDNTGLPHVFEHATLAGSKKYPSKDLWFNLANGSSVVQPGQRQLQHLHERLHGLQPHRLSRGVPVRGSASEIRGLLHGLLSEPHGDGG